MAPIAFFATESFASSILTACAAKFVLANTGLKSDRSRAVAGARSQWLHPLAYAEF
jgi:hypothetical protein